MVDAPASSKLAGIGRALRNRNYRLFFVGQGISLIGSWVARTATGWLVYRLTNSSILLGMVGFCGQIPTFVLAPFAGVWVDRSDRYRVLFITQGISLVQSALLAFVALTHTVTVWHVLALVAVQGMVNAFDTPARQAFLVEMIGSRDELPNAIALNSSMFNGARLIGPSVAGVLIALFGEGWCFTIDAVSYIAVLGALAAMTIERRELPKRTTQFWGELREGLSYIGKFTPIRDLLSLLACLSLTGMSYATLMPIFARVVLRGGPSTLGLLMSSSGTGALVGALWLARRSSVLGLGGVIAAAGSCFGCGLIAFSYSRWLWLSMPLLVVSSGGMMILMASTNTLIQTIVDERMRGRVMAFHTMAFLGMTPFASLMAGALGSRFGAPAAVRIGAALSLLTIAVFTRRLPKLNREVRPVYERLGILPPVAAGVADASVESAE